MEPILALDSSGAACSAALFHEGEVLACRQERMAQGHAQALIPMLRAVMQEARVKFEGLQAIAVTRGPGSFTGVRLGLATARGLGTATGLPVLGVSSLAVLAAQVLPEEREGRDVLCAIYSKRSDIYVQQFDAMRNPRGPARAVDPTDLSAEPTGLPLVLVGSAASSLHSYLMNQRWNVILSEAPTEIDVTVLAAIADTISTSSASDWPPDPIYLRSPSVTVPSAAS